MTEYSGIRWSFFFMEEYAAMFLMSAVAAVFFLGGFESPLTHFAGDWFGRALRARRGRPRQLRPAGILYQLAAGATLIVKALGRRVPDDVAALDAAAPAHRSGDDAWDTST